MPCHMLLPSGNGIVDEAARPETLHVVSRWLAMPVEVWTHAANAESQVCSSACLRPPFPWRCLLQHAGTVEASPSQCCPAEVMLQYDCLNLSADFSLESMPSCATTFRQMPAGNRPSRGQQLAQVLRK